MTGSRPGSCPEQRQYPQSAAFGGPHRRVLAGIRRTVGNAPELRLSSHHGENSWRKRDAAELAPGVKGCGRVIGEVVAADLLEGNVNTEVSRAFRRYLPLLLLADHR